MAALPQPVWLFDLDDTLHDASHAVFGPLRESMTDYIERELGVGRDDANLLRVRYWRRYGATLLGLMRHHGVSAAHFLHHTHLLPGLEERLRASRADRQALRRLRGRRLVLTNAPRAYALRVLGELGWLGLFDGVLSIEDMRVFGDLRPKPDVRMFRCLAARLRVHPSRCILVEDTLQHQKGAREAGLRTVWMQRFVRASAAGRAAPPGRLARRPAYVDRRISRLRDLQRGPGPAAVDRSQCLPSAGLSTGS